MFSLYSQPLSTIIENQNCDYHKYADDTELSDSASVNDFNAVVGNVQSCIENAMSWMNSNKLKLNPDKTEVMVVGSAYAPLGSVGLTSIEIGDSSINLQNSCGISASFLTSCHWTGT